MDIRSRRPKMDIRSTNFKYVFKRLFRHRNADLRMNLDRSRCGEADKVDFRTDKKGLSGFTGIKRIKDSLTNSKVEQAFASMEMAR
jgi:hypothetical protein